MAKYKILHGPIQHGRTRLMPGDEHAFSDAHAAHLLACDPPRIELLPEPPKPKPRRKARAED